MPRLRLASAVQGSPALLSNFLHYKLDEGLGMRLGKLGMRYITRLLPKLSPLRMEYIVEITWKLNKATCLSLSMM